MSTINMAVPNHNPPHGMEGYDIGALSPEQQEKLNQFKVPHEMVSSTKFVMQTRQGNEKYLREHPEVDLLLAGFLGDVLTKRPENVRDFAADYFTNPQLPDVVRNKLEQRDRSLREARFNRKL